MGPRRTCCQRQKIDGKICHKKGLLVGYSGTKELLCSPVFCHFIPPSSSGSLLVPSAGFEPSLSGSWVLCYHSATAAGQTCQRQKIDGKICHKKELHVSNSGTKELLCIPDFFAILSHKVPAALFLCHQDLNPLSQDHESCVLPLCHCHWPNVPKTKN